MFAILETGGKQYKVEEGDVLDIELLDSSMISKTGIINFDTVMLVSGDKLNIGTPYVKNGKVKAKLIEKFRGDKVIVFKRKAKKQYKRKMGHRQDLMKIQIEKIDVGAAKKKAAVKEETE
mgnify:CR=1 FL=1